MASNSPAHSWNDPPVVKFESTTPGNLKHLKKRIYSTLDKEKPEASVSGTLDDLKTNITKPLNTTDVPSSTNEKQTVVVKNELSKGQGEIYDVNVSDEELLTFVTSTFKCILLESSGQCEKTLKEIDRRINLMEKSWDSKLSREVKHMMYKLAQELDNGNIEAALKIHCSLMVHNVREVKNWMVGVKHLIEIKKENQNLSSTDLASKESNR